MPPMLSRLNNILKSPWANAALFIFSVTVSFFTWIVLKPAVFFDPKLSFYERVASDYAPVTQDLIQGHGMVTFFHPPLFLVILLCVYQVAQVLNVPVQVVMGIYALVFTAGATVILYQTARQIWEPLAAFIGALLWATYPPALYNSTLLGSETPFIAILFLSVFFLLRVLKMRRHLIEYFVLGLSTGLAMLTRPVALLLPLIFIAFVWVGGRFERQTRRKLTAIALFAIAVLICVLPWEIFLYAQTQQVVLLATNDVGSVIDGSTYAYFLKYGRHVTVPDDVYELQKDFRNQKFQSLSEIARYFLSQLSTRPRAVILHFLIKAANSWYRTDSNQFDDVLLVLQIPYVLLFIITSVLAVRCTGIVRRTTVALWVIFGYFWMMTVLVLSILRYMLPAIGLLFLIVPAGVATGASWIEAKRAEKSKLLGEKT